jgi:Tfp pilus assembly protein PilF
MFTTKGLNVQKRAFGVALVVGLVLTTHAAAADFVRECAEGQDFDRQVLACSYLAEAAGSERERSMALYKRGLAYQRHALIEEAKASYDASLRMDPTFTLAYIARGRIFEDEGEGDQALHITMKRCASNPVRLPLSIGAEF